MAFKYVKLYILVFLLVIALPCAAQQTVFNVPSADVTPKGKLFLQTEGQFRPWNSGAFYNGTNYSAYGIGHNTELDATLFNVSAPNSNTITLGTGFKSAIPIPGLKEKFPAREYKFTIGSEILTSLQGKGVGSWEYAHLSGRLPITNTRLTGGVSYGTRQVFGKDTFAYITAVEQPVTKKLTLLMDWYSGNEHFAGFLISGFSYNLPKNSTIYVGYQIPNSSLVGKSGFVVELARIF